MNQQFRDDSDKDSSDFEKHLSDISLSPASDKYSRTMDQVKQQSKRRPGSLWISRTIGVCFFIAVFALTLLPFSRISVDNQTTPDLTQETSQQPLVQHALQSDSQNDLTPSYIEGIHFGRLANPVDVSNNSANDVVAFFWYPCDPCNTFEPILSQWESGLTAAVNLTRVPAIWSEEMRFHARAYYTAQALGIEEQTHNEFYATFHRENEEISNEEELIAFFARFNVSPGEVFAAFNGESTLTNLAQAEQLNRAYQIQATPSLFIGGQFAVQPSAVADFAEWIEVTDYLLEAFCDPQQPTANSVQAC